MKKGAGDIVPVNFEILFKQKSAATVNEAFDESLTIHSLSNVSINFLNNQTNAKKIISGNIFLMDFDYLDSHFHFLSDFLAPYLLLKKHIKDLKLVLVIYNHTGEKLPVSQHTNLSKYCYDILDKLDVYENSVIDLKDYKNLILENVFFTETYYNQYLEKSLPQIIEWDYLKSGFCEVANALRPHNVGLESKKIFISRMNENNEVRKIKKSLKNKNFNTKKLPKDWKIRTEHRYIKLKDEMFLENFFRTKGYDVIDPSSYSLKEQLNIFSNATHVAGLSGAGLINSIFSNHKVKLFILNPSSGYGFDHGEGPKVVGHSVVYIPEISGKGQDITRLSVDEIIERLQLEDL